MKHIWLFRRKVFCLKLAIFTIWFNFRNTARFSLQSLTKPCGVLLAFYHPLKTFLWKNSFAIVTFGSIFILNCGFSYKVLFLYAFAIVIFVSIFIFSSRWVEILQFIYSSYFLTNFLGRWYIIVKSRKFWKKKNVQELRKNKYKN